MSALVFWVSGFVFLNPAGCCRRPDFILTVQGTSVFLLARASHVPCQLADRAFGAQRFSGGRAGRRFAPPSAAGNALKTRLRRLKAGPRGLKPGLRDWTTGPLGLTTGLRGLRAKSAKPGFQSLKPSFKTPKPSLQSPKPRHQVSQSSPRDPNEGPVVRVRGFCKPRPERWLGFGVSKLGFEDLAGGPAKGSSGWG